MDISAALQKLGLNTTESAIYLYLTQNGPSYAAQLQTALAFQKVPVYRALKELKAGGYVETLGETRNQRFAALPPAKLLGRYDEQVAELRQARTGLEDFMTRLTDQQSELYKQNNITICEGKSGFRLWNEERLHKDVTVIREWGSDIFLHDFFDPAELHPYMRDYIARRVSKGIHMRVLHDSAEPVVDYDHSNPKVLKETHLAAMPQGTRVFMSTFGSRFGFYTQQQGRYVGVIVDDPMVTQMLSWLFDALWSASKKV